VEFIHDGTALELIGLDACADLHEKKPHPAAIPDTQSACPTKENDIIQLHEF
jgi:hypothetical protein